MSKVARNLIILFNCIAMLASVLGMVFLLNTLEWYLQTIIYTLIAVFTIGCFAFLWFKKTKLAKSFFVCNVTLLLVLAVFFLLNVFGLFESFSDMEYIKSLILSSGGWGVVVCVLILIFQVVVLPVPALIFYLVITALYGGLWAFIICYFSTILGSVIAFTIGKKLGRPAVEWCIGKQDTDKYSSLLNDKGRVPFVIMQLLPFFPDDLLCMVAGLSRMSYKFFIITMILVKPLYIALVCFLGTGDIIPFSGWGIPVWIGVFAVIICACILYFCKQKQVDDFLKRVFQKNEGKR